MVSKYRKPNWKNGTDFMKGTLDSLEEQVDSAEYRLYCSFNSSFNHPVTAIRRILR